MNNFELIDQIIRTRNKWEGTGLLEGLSYEHQLKLPQLLESGQKFLVELGNGVYDEIEEFNKFKSIDDFSDLFLSVISRKYQTILKPFNLKDLVLLLNNNANLYYELREKAETMRNGKKQYLFDYDEKFEALILDNDNEKTYS